MRDVDCVAFLQWALPNLGMRWQGFRRVRRQVCRRLARRLRELQLDDLAHYRRLLAGNRATAEWTRLESACRISISRFYRDREVFRRLEREFLPRLLDQARARGVPRLRVWSIGCASGEEPYTLALMGAFTDSGTPRDLEIVATDVDPQLLQRARRACYRSSSLRELPMAWHAAFEVNGDQLCLAAHYRASVRFVEQDVRRDLQVGPFDLILCRNLVFTYFAPPLQLEIAARLIHELAPGGLLLLGTHETLPAPLPALATECPWLYRRRPGEFTPECA